jgi:hypothetical protein
MVYTRMFFQKMIITVLPIFLILSTACSPALVSIQPPNLDEVNEALGYGLAPTIMLKGFEFDSYDVSSNEPYTTTLVYKRLKNSDYQYLFVMYPVSLPSSTDEVLTLENLVLKWQHPDDSSIRTEVNGEKAQLVYGSWSDDSLSQLENPDPDFLTTYIPEWNYNKDHSLYLDYKLPSDETIKIVIRVLSNPFGWISGDELVTIAGSIVRIPFN